MTTPSSNKSGRSRDVHGGGEQPTPAATSKSGTSLTKGLSEKEKLELLAILQDDADSKSRAKAAKAKRKAVEFEEDHDERGKDVHCLLIFFLFLLLIFVHLSQMRRCVRARVVIPFLPCSHRSDMHASASPSSHHVHRIRLQVLSRCLSVDRDLQAREGA